jgi:hypothetical protein
MDYLARAQRDYGVVSQRIFRRHLPILLDQSNGLGVSLQAVECGAVAACERLQFVQCMPSLERLGIKLNGGMRAEDTRASAGGLLSTLWMRGAVSAEKKLWIARGGRLD